MASRETERELMIGLRALGASNETKSAVLSLVEEEKLQKKMIAYLKEQYRQNGEVTEHQMLLKAILLHNRGAKEETET